MGSCQVLTKPFFILVLLLLMALSIPELHAEHITANSIQSAVFEEGDAYIHGLVYFQGYVWACTRTKPCRILRINPATLSYERIMLDEHAFEGEDMIAAQGQLYIILYGPPSRIVRLNPHTLELKTMLQFPEDELTRGGALEYAHDALWAGGGDGRIARIDLKDFSYELYDFSTALGRLQIHSLAAGGGYIWASSPLYRGGGDRDNESIVLRIDPRRPTDYAALFLKGLSVSDDMAYHGNRLYLGSEEGGTSVLSITDNLTWRAEGKGKAGCNGIFMFHKTIWAACSGEPGLLLRLNPGSLFHDVLSLPPGLNHANEIVFDPEGNSIFISCWQNPAALVRIDLSRIGARVHHASIM